MLNNHQHNQHPVDRLRRTLLANGEPAEDLESLVNVGHFLQQSAAPQVDDQRRSAVLNLLLDELATQHTVSPVETVAVQPAGWWSRLGSWLDQCWWLLILRSQVRIVSKTIWAGSALVMLLGVVVTLPQATLSAAALPFTMIAPLVTACGVALLYDDMLPGIHELEDSTRASLPGLILARLVLLFSFDLLLALAGSVILALVNTEISLLPLILSWLAPVTFLAALAFFLSVFLLDALAAAAFSLTLWIVYLLVRADDGRLLQRLSAADFSTSGAHLPLLLGALTLVVMGLWLVGTPSRKFEDYR